MKKIALLLTLLLPGAPEAQNISADMVQGPDGIGTMKEHTSGWVNVKTYGAVGDGRTPDTDAIQAALNAGRNVFFPPGSYVVARPLIAQGSSVIHGAGRYITSIDAYFSGADLGKPIITYGAGQHPSLRDLQFNAHGNDGGLTTYGASGVLFSTAYYAEVADVAFANLRGDGAIPAYGIKLAEAAGSMITRCEFLSFHGSTDVGVLLSGGSGTLILRNHFATQAYDVSTDTSTASGAVIIGNDFDPSGEGEGAFANSEVGILVHKGQGTFFIDGNYFEGSGPHPIQPFNVGVNGSGAALSVVSITKSNIAAGIPNSTTQSVLDNITSLEFTANMVGQPSGISFGSAITMLREGVNTYWAAPTYSAAGRFSTGANWSTYPVEVVNATSANLGRFYRTNAGAGLQLSADSNGAVLTTEGVHAFQFNANGIRVKIDQTGLHLPNDAGTLQTGTVYQGFGAPSGANGKDGDIYFRTDGTTGSTIYHRRSGSWVPIL